MPLQFCLLIVYWLFLPAFWNFCYFACKYWTTICFHRDDQIYAFSSLKVKGHHDIETLRTMIHVASRISGAEKWVSAKQKWQWQVLWQLILPFCFPLPMASKLGKYHRSKDQWIFCVSSVIFEFTLKGHLMLCTYGKTEQGQTSLTGKEQTNN